MRLNQFIAQNTSLSRRRADTLIKDGMVLVNDIPATIGQIIGSQDKINVNGTLVQPKAKFTTIMLNKPIGYVCSRNGQGSKTVYDLLPPEFHNLKPVGRLDKDSSGLILLTDDGQLANQLTHPRYQKEKVYEVELDRTLSEADKTRIENGVKLEDGISTLRVLRMENAERRMEKSSNPRSSFSVPRSAYEVRLAEGKNRQIRRTFAAVGYKVINLHRTQFGNYELGNIKQGTFQII